MFSFFKKKSYLRDLIPDQFIDIHSHLLPGIDDGAKSLEDTFFLITEMKALGFSNFITTPHVIRDVWNNTKEIITETEKNTIHELKNNDFKIPLKAAAEYMLNMDFVKLYETESLLTLKDHYVLVEMSYISAPNQLYEILFGLQNAGYTPVLAHPERYLFYYANFDEYDKLKRAGCLFQLNLLSTVGYYGLEVFRTAKKLLDNDMIDFVGSDIHHEKHVKSFQQEVLLKDLTPFREAIERNSIFKLEKTTF